MVSGSVLVQFWLRLVLDWSVLVWFILRSVLANQLVLDGSVPVLVVLRDGSWGLFLFVVCFSAGSVLWGLFLFVCWFSAGSVLASAGSGLVCAGSCFCVAGSVLVQFWLCLVLAARPSRTVTCN